VTLALVLAVQGLLCVSLGLWLLSEVRSSTLRKGVRNMRDTFLKGFAGLSAMLATMAVVAGVASADVLTDAVDSVESQVIGYAAPIGAAIVAVGLAFVAVKLIPRVIKWVSNRLG
jgi:hypothetical protein